MVAKIGLSKKNGIGMLFNWQRRIRKDAGRRETNEPVPSKNADEAG